MFISIYSTSTTYLALVACTFETSCGVRSTICYLSSSNEIHVGWLVLSSIRLLVCHLLEAREQMLRYSRL
ncbi:hypothetical protein LINPERPRIM_LOCUS34565 [Linum perenne]